MKRIILITSLFFILIIGLSLTSCDSKLQGTYIKKDSSDNTVYIKKLVFNDDKVIVYETITLACEYEINDGKIYMSGNYPLYGTIEFTHDFRQEEHSLFLDNVEFIHEKYWKEDENEFTETEIEGTSEATEPETTTAPEPEIDIMAKSEGVMTHSEYLSSPLDSKVVIETFVQAKQSWWKNDRVGGVATFYTQDDQGGYFIYDMPVSQEDYNRMVVGTKLRITGEKVTYKGETEIIDAQYEILEGSYIAEAIDVTDQLSNHSLINKQNMLVSFKGMIVEPSIDPYGNPTAFLYGWDGSGKEGSDLYFNVSINGTTYNFMVESYLTGADSDVYKTVQKLNIGDKIDLEGFLYWYDGVSPHITELKVAE